MSGIIGEIGASRSGLVGFHTPKKVQYTTLLNSWVQWNTNSSTSSEQGLSVQNMGKIWIVHCSMEKNIAAGQGYDIVVNLGTDFTHPVGTVICGTSHFGYQSHNDYTSNIEIDTSGNVTIYYNNSLDQGMQVVGNYMGLDVS